MPIKFTTEQQLNNLARNIKPILEAIEKGYHTDPRTSDLDDEQSIYVSISLGDYRKASSLLYEIRKMV